MIRDFPFHPEDACLIREGAEKRNPEITRYDDTQLYVIVHRVDRERYDAFLAEEKVLTEDETEWAEKHFVRGPRALVPYLMKIHEEEGFSPVQSLTDRTVTDFGGRYDDYGGGLLGMRVSLRGYIDSGDAAQMSRFEEELRNLAFEIVWFFRKYRVPGFEKAFVVSCNSFFGTRGGPFIDAEHTLTVKEQFEGARFDDVLFVNIHEGTHGGDREGFDVPYSMCLPKGVDGLLVTGRGAGYERRGHDPTGMRARPSMMVFGQTVGTAAAVASLDGKTVKKCDLKKVQSELHRSGIYLGDDERLRELGISV
jgi:hypothetical protein